MLALWIQRGNNNEMKNVMFVRICILGLGTPHISEGEVLVAGGKPGWAAPPNPRIGPWLRLLRTIAESQKLTPEFEVNWKFFIWLFAMRVLCSFDNPNRFGFLIFISSYLC